MKTEKNILLAFILNISFSIIEFIGGLFTNSVAIISDSIHDFGDAISIFISYILEKVSKRKPDNKYTYGYTRYSILGALITTIILTIGSVIVILSSIDRIFNPAIINYDGMIYFAIIGVIINFLAAYFTREGDSLNQKSVNLHMLEDVFGWVIVLVGAFVIKFTKLYVIDSIMSIGLAIFILFNCIKNLKEILDLFLEKTPKNISIEDVKSYVEKIDNVLNVHHIHIWSMDGENNYATMHVVVEKDRETVKKKIKEELKEHNIIHTTIEIENKEEECLDLNCEIKAENINGGHHHHHHHHHHH